MKRLAKYYIILFFSILFFSISHLVCGQDSRYEEMKKIHRDRLNNARIDITGIVTDTEDVRLDNVDLRIEFRRPKNFWATHSEWLNETMKINGSFSIRKEHYTSVTIRFYKDGYFSEEITLYTGKKADARDSAIQSHFHIKLRKIGTLAKLIEFDERIKYDVKSNNQSVCDLTKLETGNLRNEVFPLGNPIRLKKYIYLDFERDKQGNIIYEENNGRGIHAPAPKTYLLKFVSSDPSDGFIPIDENTPIKDLSYLTDAPQKEYTAKELVIPYKNDRRYYFYIRCGNYYGKGVVANIGARNDAFDHDYSLLVEILINQKNGDMNLRSR